MLQRNLIYTKITRAKTGLVLVGSRKAVWIAVNNMKVEKRNTLLAERLKGNDIICAIMSVNASFATVYPNVISMLSPILHMAIHSHFSAKAVVLKPFTPAH